MHAFEHHFIALIVERDGEAHDAAIVAFRFDRDDCELRRYGIANESRPLVTRLVAEHGDHGLGEFRADRRGTPASRERGGPGGSRAERLTHLAMLSVWALGSATSGRSGAGKPRQASIGAGGSGISAANSATVQRKKLKHSKLGSGRHQRLLLLPAEAQQLLWLRATTRKYVTITGWSILPSAAISA